MTKYEKAIYLLVQQSTWHPTAEQVFYEMRKEYPAISLATVYNNLKKLCDAGAIRRISLEGAPDRYDRPTKHDHIVCSRCGKLMDVCFEDLTDSLQRQLDGELLFYDLKVYILCSACRQEAPVPEEPVNFS